MIILIMGLPGSGKTTLAEELHKRIKSSVWLNADRIRAAHEDWDFSPEGRLRQAHRMQQLSILADKDVLVIIDMVCPLEEMRDIINPHFLVWVDTIKKSQYVDTNQMFQPPTQYNYRVPEKNYRAQAEIIHALINQRTNFIEKNYSD